MKKDPDKYAWVKYTRDLLCSYSVGNVWRDQSVLNKKLFLLILNKGFKDVLHKS